VGHGHGVAFLMVVAATLSNSLQHTATHFHSTATVTTHGRDSDASPAASFALE